MKTKDSELNLIWDELKSIFWEYRRMDSKIISRLNAIGVEVEKNKSHAKLYFNIHGERKFTVISSTPSDKQAGRQILRQIRRMYER